MRRKKQQASPAKITVNLIPLWNFILCLTPTRIWQIFHILFFEAKAIPANRRFFALRKTEENKKPNERASKHIHSVLKTEWPNSLFGNIRSYQWTRNVFKSLYNTCNVLPNMLYSLYVGAGFPVGDYAFLHIIHQEVLSSRSTSLPALFYSPPVGPILTFFVL